MEEQQRIDKESEKQMILRSLKTTYEEKKERLRATIENDSKIKRVLGKDADLEVRARPLAFGLADVALSRRGSLCHQMHVKLLCSSAVRHQGTQKMCSIGIA